jgi:hypothetical protein
MSNSAVATIVLLCPVEDRLGECSDRGAEADDWRYRVLRNLRLVDVEKVGRHLEDIYESYVDQRSIRIENEPLCKFLPWALVKPSPRLYASTPYT